MFYAVLAAALLPTMFLARPAAASTGGTFDAANQYSNVGLIMFYDATGRYRCSATLISPTVLVTAAHCTDGVVGSVLVDFRNFIAETGPSPYAQAADPAAGYTDEEIEAMGFVSGTAHTHPEYSDFTDMDNWNDVGVVVLDDPVGIAPAELADLGTLDAIAGNLRKTLFRAVGYGTEVRKSDDGPQNPTPQSYPLQRRYVDMPGQKLTAQILQTNGNERDVFGSGGTCFGDSGGPVFYQGEIVAVTSYGYTENCRYLGGYQRLDIAVTQDWVNSFLS
ncbi:MAG TPA: trypsin-like serine protease [Nocardioides sp.]|nr:trypsin-like serine protease [Nocardioides sp.]